MASATDKIRHRYDRFAPLFNRMSKMDRMVDKKQREELIGNVRGKVLEVGVGTGANLKFYPENVSVTAIDFSSKMLSFAEEHKNECSSPVTLLQMDIQSLEFADNTFDTVISTCVFCSVPNPIQGLREIRRVLKPDGRLLMIEHMLSDHFPIALLLQILNPLTVRISGANVNRRTMDNIAQAGFSVTNMQFLAFSDVVRRIEAVPNK